MRRLDFAYAHDAENQRGSHVPTNCKVLRQNCQTRAQLQQGKNDNYCDLRHLRTQPLNWIYEFLQLANVVDSIMVPYKEIIRLTSILDYNFGKSRFYVLFAAKLI